MKMKYINLDKVCSGCNRKCNKELKDYIECIKYRGQIEKLENYEPKDINFNEEIKNIIDIKDMIKFYILWYLDDSKCNIAITQSKELSECVEKIISDLTNVYKLDIILAEYYVQKRYLKNHKKS